MTKAGKITNSDFDEIFSGRFGFSRNEVVTGPAFGVDVSVIDLGNNHGMAITSDPLSLIPTLGLQESAWLSVHLMANDMATTGFAPMYGQFVLNLPTYLTQADFKEYWTYIHKYCSDLKVAITGGHTGTIEGQNSTIAGGGTFITLAAADKILTSEKAKPGDTILLTKQCAISSAALLAMSFPQTVKSKLGNEIFNDACDLFYQTSSLKEALIAAKFNDDDIVVSAMHDVTEGGVLGAIYEMAVASGNGALIYEGKIPVGNAPKEICQFFSIDPKYSIGAGAMLISIRKNHEKSLIKSLSDQFIDCTMIGEMKESDQGINIVKTNGETLPLQFQSKDPYWNAFFYALKNDWK